MVAELLGGGGGGVVLDIVGLGRIGTRWPVGARGRRSPHHEHETKRSRHANAVTMCDKMPFVDLACTVKRKR